MGFPGSSGLAGGVGGPGGVNMTRISYMVSSQIKQFMPLVTQVHPNVWYARGPLPFHQGIMPIYKAFAGKHPGDVVSHPYFLEPTYSPEQPSPQFQLTEEVGAVMRLTRGYTDITDRLSLLDNTVTLVYNPTTEKFVVFNPIQFDETTKKQAKDEVIDDDGVSHIIAPTLPASRSETLLQWAKEYPSAKVLVAGAPIPELGSRCQTLPKDQVTVLKETGVELHYIPGEPGLEEFVLFHPDSKMLSCTDLYHGPYQDYDPCNTWMCRVWFKFARKGNYKSTTILPGYRRSAIEAAQPDGMAKMQQVVEKLCTLNWNKLVYAHGTPMIIENAKNILRAQYDLEPREDYIGETARADLYDPHSLCPSRLAREFPGAKLFTKLTNKDSEFMDKWNPRKVEIGKYRDSHRF
jgi:hypothetical protein